MIATLERDARLEAGSDILSKYTPLAASDCLTVWFKIRLFPSIWPGWVFVKILADVAVDHMKRTLLPEQISRIVRLAWEDRTSFEEIEKRTGFVERDVIAVMRRELKPSSFRLWRKRVNGRITKHRRLLERKLKGPPAMDFDD